jgi:glutathione S-transferase
VTDKPTLYVFAISHYCEKARWTLDYLGIEHTLRHLPPGAHGQVAAELGAPGSSLPILVAGEEVIQGSDAIFDWACSTASETGKSLEVDPELTGVARETERRLDDLAGVQTRRYFYSEALVEYPETVLPVFSKDLAGDERASLADIWELVTGAMINRMDLGREQWNEAREIIAGELDWLDEMLSDGRAFLVGDHFSRVDITAASLLAIAAGTPEHPTYSSIEIPPRVKADMDLWRDRPTLVWVRGIYKRFRSANAPG